MASHCSWKKRALALESKVKNEITGEEEIKKDVKEDAKEG
jgi:hypothetical protein